MYMYIHDVKFILRHTKEDYKIICLIFYIYVLIKSFNIIIISLKYMIKKRIQKD